MDQLLSSIDSSPPVGKVSPTNSAAGIKRPAPSLLPAFEPFSSSPPLPRPLKRQARASPSKYGLEKKYPTPIPTSSTGMMPSSSPPQPSRRLGLQRTLSTFSERAPLSAVPTIELDEHSQPTLMGRSSNSSHYQLSTNKLISRVHVRATYFPTNASSPKKVFIECVGWNGVKVHCQGRAWDLRKGDSFTSATEDADIMIDVHDARVLLQWPRHHENKISTPTDSDHSENSPRHILAAVRHTPNQSPLRQQHIHPPISPSSAVQGTSSTLFSSDSVPATVQVYEDEPSDDVQQSQIATQIEATQPIQQLSQPLGASLQESFSSPLAESKDFSDADEENDPIVHAFGPFGSNISRRMESFKTGDSPPHWPLNPLKEASISPQRHHSPKSAREGEHGPIVNHVINQLAYAQRSSTPLSILMDHLPTFLKQSNPNSKENPRLTVETFVKMLDAAPCVGEVSREGKDAAGKPLESEYYYVPDMDSEEKRRNAVVEGLRKPGLRACRKQHKQYYWRKPK